MNPWLLHELDSLQDRIDRLDFSWELSQELRSIRQEVESIGGACFAGGPMAPLLMAVEDLETREAVFRLSDCNERLNLIIAGE